MFPIICSATGLPIEKGDFPVLASDGFIYSKNYMLNLFAGADHAGSQIFSPVTHEPIERTLTISPGYSALVKEAMNNAGKLMSFSGKEPVAHQEISEQYNAITEFLKMQMERGEQQHATTRKVVLSQADRLAAITSLNPKIINLQAKKRDLARDLEHPSQYDVQISVYTTLISKQENLIKMLEGDIETRKANSLKYKYDYLQKRAQEGIENATCEFTNAQASLSKLRSQLAEAEKNKAEYMHTKTCELDAINAELTDLLQQQEELGGEQYQAPHRIEIDAPVTSSAIQCQSVQPPRASTSKFFQPVTQTPVISDTRDRLSAFDHDAGAGRM